VKGLDNIWLKVIALIVGLLLWFHVITEKTYNHRLQLPITDIVLGEDLVLTEAPPDSMTVLVTAKGKQLLRRKWRQRGVRIHAAQLPAGRHTLNLTTSNTTLADAGNLIKLAEVIAPTSIQLNIDFKVEKKVKVLPDITPVPDEGFTVSRISEPDPPEVTLIGARSLLRRYTTVSTVHKELTGLRNNLTLTLPLAVPEAYAMVLNPDSVTVTIEIVAVRTRVFENVPIVVRNAPPGKMVMTQPPTVRVEITGPPQAIDRLPPDAVVASVDFNRVDSNGNTPIEITCPPQFKVKKSSADLAKVIVD
jgi:YbbR domain-containing protein